MPLLFKTPEPRNQIKMISLESLIPLDSEVRLLDEMVDSFFETILAHLLFLPRS